MSRMMAANWGLMTNPMDDATGRRMSSAFNAIPLVRQAKPEVDISLDDHQAGCYVPSYTTLDKIQGHATVTAPVDMPYDSVHVIFQGASKTFVEKIATTSPTTPRTQAYHNFLRLVQPLDATDLPADQVLRAGVTYHLPFTFVVPDRLLPQACTHAKEKDAVMDAHLALPPSLGDPMMAGDGRSLLDDLSPNMTMISYGIRVILTRKERQGSGGGPAKSRALADAMKKLRIIPATDEQPPLLSQGDGGAEDDYQLCRTKDIKRGVFKGKLGTLTMHAAQPAPLRLPFIREETQCHTTTMAHVDLVFEPVTPSAKPPKLGQLWAKLKAATFYATSPMKDFPAKSAPFMYDSHRGLFVETLPLSSRSVASTQWTRVEPTAATPKATALVSDADMERRDSGVSVPPPKSSSPCKPTGLHYTARVLVPIDLPTSSKSFVATFHTCLLSRIYALDLALQVQASKKVPGSGATLHLKLPLQITQDANKDAAPIISDAEAAHIRARAAAFEASATFVPRSTAPPTVDPAAPRTASPENLNGEVSPRAGSPQLPASATASASASPQLADLQLRGARGSVFAAPRWGTAAWGPMDPAAMAGNPNAAARGSGLGIVGEGLERRPSDALWSRRNSSDEDSEELVESGVESMAQLREALDDDVSGHDTVRRRATGADLPPEYTAFNGIVSRRGGMNIYT